MRRNKRGKRGIVLVAVCLCLLLLLAGLGLGVDLNRLLAAQTALRSDAEAAALAAVLELDGTPAGLERARIRAAATWRRQAEAGAVMAIEFAASPAGPWDADPFAADPLKAARVTASSTLALSLLRGVIGEKSLPVRAVARAAQNLLTHVDSGLLPLAARADGQLLNGLTVEAAEPSSARLAILNGLAMGVKAGDRLTLHAGALPVVQRTLREIVQSDTDPVSTSYAAYASGGRGNGRRLVALPIVDGELRVTGFAAFFLRPADSYGDANTAMGAEPAGGFLQGSRYRANAADGAWRAEVVAP